MLKPTAEGNTMTTLDPAEKRGTYDWVIGKRGGDPRPAPEPEPQPVEARS